MARDYTNKLHVKSNMHGVVRHLKQYNKGRKCQDSPVVLTGKDYRRYKQRDESYKDSLIRRVLGI
jgi:hypothetical protein